MNVRLSLIFIVTLSLALSCKQKEKKKQSLFSDELPAKSLDSSRKTTDEEEEIKFIGYHFNYDTAKTDGENLAEGWLDTFTIDRQQFHLKFDTAATDEKLVVEQFKNGQWIKLFSPSLGQDGYARNDIDNDGFIDFVRLYHARTDTYFYDPVRKTFNDTIWGMPENRTVIDKSTNLQYNYYEAMYGHIYESSQLYTYKDHKPYFYYVLQFETNEDNDFKKLNLYKFNNGEYEDTVFVKTIASGNNIKFNYDQYWKNNYRQLMANK